MTETSDMTVAPARRTGRGSRFWGRPWRLKRVRFPPARGRDGHPPARRRAGERRSL